MGFLQAYGAYWTNYVNFRGRSSRSAYWWVQLWNFLIFILFLILIIGPLIRSIATNDFANLGIALIAIFTYVIYLLAILIPSISLGIRRFHDANVSAWWYVGLVIIPNAIEGSIDIATDGQGTIYYLFLAISLITGIIALIITLLPSKDPNKFGTISE